MEFSWSETQEALYRETLRFAREQLNSTLAERAPKHQFGHTEWKRCGEYGVLGLLVPETYGGRGFDALVTARVFEALGRGCEDAGLLFSMSAHLFACAQPIAQFATDDLKSEILPELAAGRMIGSNAITEPEAGSDAFALRTRVVRDGDSYVLDGEKSYVTNAPVGDIMVVYANQNPKHGYLGISAFVVYTKQRGVTVGQPAHKVGLTTSPMSAVYLDGCRVPARNLLGREGQGVRVFNKSMIWERACLFALYTGMLDRQLDQTVAFVKERQQFGKPLGKHQAVAHRIADMKIRLEGARLLLYRTCWRIATGQDADLDTALSKIAISEAALKNGLDAIHLHGGMGIVNETGIARTLIDALPSTLFSGTSEMQRDRIARKLGL